MITTAIIREASEYGAGCIYMHSAIPVIMITIQLDDQDDIIEFALMVQQLLHELGSCGCDEE